MTQTINKSVKIKLSEWDAFRSKPFIEPGEVRGALQLADDIIRELRYEEPVRSKYDR
jgi:hypothetical protein